jgi:hypothetical protein
MRQRTQGAINVGNLLELVGAVCAVYAVISLAGVAWGILLAGILIVVAAELIYDEHVWRFSLPLRPQPSRWITERRQSAGLWKLRQSASRRARRAR